MCNFVVYRLATLGAWQWKIMNLKRLATFALHNYIRVNSPNDRVFQILDQHPDYVPVDELSYFASANEENTRRRSEMKDVRDQIAESLWLAKRQN